MIINEIIIEIVAEIETAKWASLIHVNSLKRPIGSVLSRPFDIVPGPPCGLELLRPLAREYAVQLVQLMGWVQVIRR